MRDYFFSNYQSLNNGNLFLELGEILKQKWQKKLKKSHVELTKFHSCILEVKVCNLIMEVILCKIYYFYHVYFIYLFVYFDYPG